VTRYARLVLLLVLLPLVGAGCATYQSHYTAMKAETAGGKERRVRLTWRTADYPFWYGGGREATPVRMETQCSERVWTLKDPTMEGACSDEGIAACGKPALDVDRDRDALNSESNVCVTLTDADGSDRIVDLGNRLELSVQCYPGKTELGSGDESVNVDYLRASVVPYTLSVRTAPLGSLTQRPPELDDHVCDLDK